MKDLLAATLLATAALALGACDRWEEPRTSPPITNSVDPSPEPDFECPAGMPAYKCQQLKDLHQPTSPPPST